MVANARTHGTTNRVPWEALAEERPPPGPAAGSGHAGAIPAAGPEGVPGRLRQLGGLPVRCPLEVGGNHGAGG